MSPKVIIEPNSNYHHISGDNLFEKRDARFTEYRKKWKEWPEKFFQSDFPLFIDAEVTSSCNLKCPFCASTYRKGAIKNGLMSFETCKKIIDEGVENNLYGVKFNIRGEPLLHPKIHEFVKYAKKKGLIDVYFNTNAMLLTEKTATKLIEAGLDRLSISFEGYTKEVYENNRPGAKFDVVIKNIETLQALKKKIGVSHPKVRIQTVMLPEIEAGFEEYEKFWNGKADELGFLDYKEMKEKKKGLKYPWACPQIWQRMAIWWDGTILPCNHDDDALLELGNVSNSSVKECWNSQKLKKVREEHKKGNAHTISACDGCYLRDSEILKLKQKENA